MPTRRELVISRLVPWTRRVRIGAAVLIALFLASSAVPSGAGAQSIDVRLGFDGAFVHGRWSPVRVDVSGGAEPFTGTVEIEIPRSTLLSVEPAYAKLSAPISVGARETRRLWLSVPLQATPHPALAVLVDAAGRVRSARQISLKDGAVQDGLTLVLDPSGERWSWLAAEEAGGRRGALATLERASDLPSDPLVLASISAIVIAHDFPVASLGPGQLAALREYVRFGGSLVFTGGSTPPSLPGGLLEWLPFPPTGRVVPVASGEAQVPAWELRAPPEAVLHYAGELPLMTAAPVDAGRVTYVAVDPASPSSRSLLPMELWTAGLLGDGEKRWADLSPAHVEEIWRVLGRAAIDSSPPFLFTASLAAYVALLIGALALARRTAIALWAAGGLVLAGSSLAWLAAPGLTRSHQSAFAELQIVHEVAPGVAVGRSYGIVTSGSPVPFAVNASAAPTMPFPGASARTSVDVTVTPGGIRFESVRPGESVRIVHETIEPFPVSAYIDEDSTVRVVNGGDGPLRLAYLVWHDWYTPLGTIAPGGVVTTQIPAQAARGSSSFVTLSIQSHLERLDAKSRPSAMEARLISFAVGRALDSSLFSGRRDAPLLVALAEPAEHVVASPAGREYRRRVIVAPLADGAERRASGAG